MRHGMDSRKTLLTDQGPTDSRIRKLRKEGGRWGEIEEEGVTDKES